MGLLEINLFILMAESKIIKSVAIVAGELSGDNLGSGLMEA